MKALTFIEEWMAPYLPVFYQLDAFLAALVGCALVLPLRAPPIRALIVIVLIAMTLTHVRHQTLLALITPIILAAPIARAIESRGRFWIGDARLAPRRLPSLSSSPHFWRDPACFSIRAQRWRRLVGISSQIRSASDTFAARFQRC